MVTYNREEMKRKIQEIMDTEYEQMYPFELEKSLASLAKESHENKDEETLKEINWEIDLLNKTFGHKGEYQGKEVVEISNKWEFYLEANTSELTKPLSNIPFCEWKKEAVDYYKQRYDSTDSELSKARYAFAVMTVSQGLDRLEFAKKSIEAWLKTAEKYVQNKKYAEFYDITPFAYEFALKLSLSFAQKESAKKILESLHKSIFEILTDGDKRWNFEFFKIESIYVNKIGESEKIKGESVNKIKEIVKDLEKKIDGSDYEQKDSHFLRSYIFCLLNYKTEDEYILNKQIADSFVKEAELMKEPMIQSSFYSDAIKKYKVMQSKFQDKKEDINKEIETLILRIKEINTKIRYKAIQTEITITKKQIDDYISNLEHKNEDVLIAFLEDNSFFSNIKTVKEETLKQKKTYPLQFIMPVVVSDKEGLIIKIVPQEDVFDYHVRRNLLMGIKICEIMTKMTIESLEKDLGLKIFDKVDKLLKIEELRDIYPTLSRGFSYIFDKPKDYIAGLHIIVPYIEEVIRRIIQKAGKVDVVLESKKTKYFRGIELGSLLGNDKVKELVGGDFATNMKVLLVDDDQTNLRNELLHGRWVSDDIEEGETVFVAYCLLKLIKILGDYKR